jgi:hypothetical protein
MPRSVLTFWILLAAATAVSARDIYVNNVAGDDRNRGNAEKSTVAGGGPCRTIARALRAAERGDQIVLANTGVPYHESITLEGGRHSGYLTRPFVIRGNGAILDGSWPVPHHAWEHFDKDVFRFRPHRTAYQQFFLDDKPMERVAAAEGSTKVPDLEPLTWCFVDRHIYFRPEKDKLPQHYKLTYAGWQTGITLYKCERVVVENLIVQGFQLDGINAHDGVFDSELLNVIARGNGRSGVSIGGASRVKLSTCVLGNNGAAQLRTEGWSTTHVNQCELIDNTAPGLVREAGRVTIDGEPLAPNLRIYPEPASEADPEAEGVLQTGPEAEPQPSE